MDDSVKTDADPWCQGDLGADPRPGPDPCTGPDHGQRSDPDPFAKLDRWIDHGRGMDLRGIGGLVQQSGQPRQGQSTTRSEDRRL
jgi:hypothetical protein